MPRPTMRSPALPIFLAFALAARCALAGEPANDKALLPPEQAIEQGLFFLQKQQKGDGSFDAGANANAMTGLAILAFLSSGHTPDVGKYGLTVRNAVDYLVKLNPEGGYFGRDGGRMYSHAIVTVALAEVYGNELDDAQRKRVRATLDQAVKVLFAAQDVRKEKGAEGGWRYELNSSDSDLSVTAWCILALMAARDAGLEVPQERLDRADRYVKACYRQSKKGYAYTPGDDPSAAMNAAGMLTLLLLDARPQEDALDTLVKKPPRDGERFFYYTLYYSTRLAFQTGDQKVCQTLWKNAFDQLVPAQRRDDGSWNHKSSEPGGDNKPGRFYSTAMAVLTLSVPMNLLPVYQK